MLKILVGSKNPVKIEATREAFSKFFENVKVEGIEASSLVPPQPIDKEVWDGAKNRASYLHELHEGDYFVGIEGGLYSFPYGVFELGVTCIISKNGKISFGGAPFFSLPPHIIERVMNREELSSVLDDILNTKEIGKKEGAIGHLTRHMVLRKDLYIQSTVMALVPFLNPKLFHHED